MHEPMPDGADVDALLVAWADRVRANREQVDRFREVPDGPDFYGPVSSMYRADPDRVDDAQLDALLALSARIAAEPTHRMVEQLDPMAFKAAPRAPRRR